MPVAAHPFTVFYTIPGALGGQPDSRYRREPTSKFATLTREGRAKVFISREIDHKGSFGKHGSGKFYETDGAMGRQTSSRYSTRPRSAFARSDRFAHERRERAMNITPGPGYYDY